jgi:sirohydrochlorin ferrochelatase
VEMDWRTVTLVTAGGDRVVVANSTLAKGNLTIRPRQREGVGYRTADVRGGYSARAGS